MKQLSGGDFKLCELWGKRNSEAFEAIFWRPDPPLTTVFPVNPYYFHERLHQQQGLFLCPGDVSKSFEANLLRQRDYKNNVKLILITQDCRKEILWRLHRAGLNRELLFPGFEGFAKSLCITAPLLFLRQKELERNKARVPTDSRGDFLWEQYNPSSGRAEAT